MIQTPTPFDISELNLHGLSLDELGNNRWNMLPGYGRKEIIVRSVQLSARVFPEYVVDVAMTTELSGLTEFLLKSEVQTIVDVLAHKGMFTGMHAASEYNAK
ncbi:MAG: hypothetical protein QG589_2 [Patescibacteria group bacterium]|nr:hypothetical protein [Patescibacteria group bacterium]